MEKVNILIVVFIATFVAFSLDVLALDDAIKIIGAKTLHQSGIRGDDYTACIIDTGIDYTHPNLGGCTEVQFLNGNCGRIVGGYDFGNDDTNPIDENGHGTLVSGILASNDSTYTGVAPNSKIVFMKILNDSWTSSSLVSDKFFLNVKRALRWCIDNSTKYNISVISMSIGNYSNVYPDNCTDFYNLSPEIIDARLKNIPVVVAAGNSFDSKNPVFKLGYPACLYNITSVGATRNSNVMAPFSNRATGLDLVAPGVDIRSTKLGGGFTNIFDDLLGCVPLFGWIFTCTSGTSFSTPQVAGAVNLIKQHDPAIKIYQIEEILRENSDTSNEGYKRINLLKALHVLDWPTENHDYRRTGFTLLKGDMTSRDVARNQLDFFLDAVNDNIEQVVKPSIADIDGDGKMDQVIIVHKPVMQNFSLMYGTTVKPTPKRKWTNPVEVRGGTDGAIYFPPTLADIDSDNKKEIITGTRNGTIYAYDFDGGQPTIKWRFVTEPRFDGLNNRTKFNGGSAVADIDLDGDMEVIVADVLDADDEWPGKVYVLDGGTGTNQTSYIVGNGGAYASVSVANIDSDDNPEIVVPTQYGIKVLDYNKATNTLTEKCSNTHGLIEGSAVISDVDKDNEYEIVYVTNNHVCAAGKTCANKLYVVNASSCGNTPELEVTFSDIPRPTVTVANLDSDSQSEIIVSSVTSLDLGLGNITAIDSVSGTRQWSYNNGGSLHPGFVSPNIADIDNDGNYNIILGENDGSMVYVLKHDGAPLFNYSVIGFMDNGIAIADLDNDGMAEIAFKRAASPETVFVSVSNINSPPEITKISNVTAIAGNLINISQLISTSDAEGNGINLFYSSPFNSSGQWQTTINDTGNYSILVEASDGNLSTTNFIDVIVFNETTKLQNQFTDGATQKLLNFTQLGNLTVNVRLPKNATVIYSKLKITGLAP